MSQEQSCDMYNPNHQNEAPTVDANFCQFSPSIAGNFSLLSASGNHSLAASLVPSRTVIHTKGSLLTLNDLTVQKKSREQQCIKMRWKGRLRQPVETQNSMGQEVGNRSNLVLY